MQVADVYARKRHWGQTELWRGRPKFRGCCYLVKEESCLKFSFVCQRSIDLLLFHRWPKIAQPSIGLASATSQLDRNPWQRVATYKSGSKQTWRRIFSVWNHNEEAQTMQTDRTKLPHQLPLCWTATARFFKPFFFFRFRLCSVF